MQTPFYASGFLYDLKTHQILLLQLGPKDDISSVWSTLGGESKIGEEAQATFQRIVYKLLKVNLVKKQIYPVYDYFHDAHNKINYVFYAEVKNPKVFNSFKEKTFSWVAFGEIVKLLFSAHTKQDVIVGERVINAKWREDQNI